MRLYEVFGIVRTLPLREGESGAEKRDRGAFDAVDEGESQTRVGPNASSEGTTCEGPSKRKSVNAFAMLAGMFTLATT